MLGVFAHKLRCQLALQGKILLLLSPNAEIWAHIHADGVDPSESLITLDIELWL